MLPAFYKLSDNASPITKVFKSYPNVKVMEGNVKFFNMSKNYGFIKADDGNEYFFHISGVKGEKVLREGDRVKFNTERGDRGEKAIDVERINS